jgi:hypothetical protein
MRSGTNMGAFLDRLSGKTPAQIAGKKAARAWMNILDQTDEDVETLTGLDLYSHAKEEACKLLRSYYREDVWKWRPEERQKPEQRHHEEFLQYVEAFVSAFPPVRRGYPKE